MTEKRFESQDNIILDAEGESLKSIDEIVDVLNELDSENDFLYDNIIKFEKENEQLKKDVEYWKRYWKQVVSLYNNELNVFEHCKEYKSKCKDIDWSSE